MSIGHDGGSVDCPLFGLIEMAYRVEEGSHTYPCAAGGEAGARAAFSDLWLGDTVWTFRGKWGLDPVECRPAGGFPNLQITGEVFFATEGTAFYEQETWRIEAAPGPRLVAPVEGLREALAGGRAR